MVGPEDREHAAAPEEAAPSPPGAFLSRELESDCARFLEDVRNLVRRREQEVARTTGRF
ncbi:MAG TPA: hypothetical protein VK915_12035 [Gaiellaceae bacterium]|nr:hypothetical protein [Gaiellaceae bacterium]